MYTRRLMESTLRRAARQFPVLLVTGARQVGKTTLLRRLAGKDRAYISLDDPMALRLALEDPALFLQRFPPPVLIDEIQYAPGLFPHIKMAVDADREPGMFWLTGSQPFHLMKGVSESLAGRVGVMNLLGLSRREIAGTADGRTPFLPDPERFARDAADGVDAGLPLPELYAAIWRGSLPVMALEADMDRDHFFASYVQTYLQRDVHALTAVGDASAFLRFLRASAARTGQLLNIALLARDADVAPNTAKKWLSILEASGVVFLLEPYYANGLKRLVKAPKLYFLDTGLAAYLAEWASPRTLEAGAMSGAFLETWLFGEILKSWTHLGLRPPVYYYRDKDRKEIDLTLIRDGTAYPVEFKKTAAPDRGMAAHFGLLEKTGLHVGPGAVVALARQAMPLTPTVWSIPAGWL